MTLRLQSESVDLVKKNIYLHINWDISMTWGADTILGGQQNLINGHIFPTELIESSLLTLAIVKEYLSSFPCDVDGSTENVSSASYGWNVWSKWALPRESRKIKAASSDFWPRGGWNKLTETQPSLRDYSIVMAHL